MSRFAEQTTVTSDKSRSEIERTLVRYGASRFMYGWEDECAAVAFEMQSRRIMFRLPMPDRNARTITHSPARKYLRSPEEQEKAYEQAVRQRWRALALVIKAKLEAVESGITVFEEEFLAHIVLPNGQQVGQWLRPQIAAAYASGKMPSLLPAPGGGAP
jgi:hypothetical protein